MDPINDMYDALVSINNILQRRKQKIGDNYVESTAMEKANSKKELLLDSSSLLNITDTNRQTSTILQLKSTTATNENKSNELHFESLTEDNFYRAHLCNRNIDELPNVSVHDIKQLKLINVYTMQDLLGRFLIHDTPEEFHTFLMKIFHLSKETASTITRLFHQWTKYNLDDTIEN